MQLGNLMQTLIELTRLLNVPKLKSSGLWGAVLESDSKMELLCEAILEGKVEDEEGAVALLYPGESRVGSKFQNLKERLKERLLHATLLSDVRSAKPTDRQMAYFETNKKWAAAMVLLSRQAKHTGHEMLDHLLKQSQFYEFTELTLNALSVLRLHYGTVAGDRTKYEQYRQSYRHFQKVWMAENEAEDLYTDLVSHFVNSKSTRLEISELAEKYYEEVKPWMEEYDAFRLHLCGRLIQIMQYSSLNDYNTTAKLCEEAIAFFKAKPYESNLPLQAFYYQLFVCYAQLREYDKGLELMGHYQSAFVHGSFNWYKLQELFFLLATHTRHYEKAREVCTTVKSMLKGNIDKLPAHIQEMWKIYDAYVQYLVHIGKLEVAEGQEKFKINRFLNDIPVFSRDKRGMNIPILIVQILFMLADKNYVDSIDRMEAVEKYNSRYLRQSDTFRSNCFLKMLLQIPASSFHHAAILRKTEKLLEQLKTVPIELANQTHEIEIIPYEDLWEMVLSTVGNKVVQVKKGRSRIA